jgi:hypothetical protein
VHSERELVIPIFMERINDNAKHVFEGVVHALCESIALLAVWRCKQLLDTKLRHDNLGHLSLELFVLIQ